MRMFGLDDGNQDKVIYSAEITQEWLDGIKSKHSWDKYNLYDNRLWEYMDELFDKVVAKSGAGSDEKLWDNLNRPQKVFWTFLAFNGDTDNGGVYQFFFNRIQFAYAATEAFQELGQHDLLDDYLIAFDEVTGFQDKHLELRTRFENLDLEWAERATGFQEGAKLLTSAKKIEDYYYNEDFKRQLHKSVADYIEQRMDQFARIIPT